MERRYAIKKRTHDEYIKELAEKNPNVIAIGQYIDANTSILHKCLKHDRIWATTPSRALQGVGCDLCHHERVSKAKTRSHEWYENELQKVAPHIRVIGKYNKVTTPIEHYCTLHDVSWNVSPDSILHGHGCWMCGNEKIGEKNRKPFETYISELHQYDPNIICIGDYVDMTTYVRHKCLIDGYEWDAVPAWLLSGRGCPLCRASRGEHAIKRWLDKHEIKYTPQKKYDDCKDERPLPFDFYLFDYNTLIEFDGEQHYRPVDFFGGEASFQKLQAHDQIKTEYCKSHQINLLRISYNEDVDTVLNNYILTQ